MLALRGLPELTVTIPENCQPPAIWEIQLLFVAKERNVLGEIEGKLLQREVGLQWAVEALGSGGAGNAARGCHRRNCCSSSPCPCRAAKCRRAAHSRRSGELLESPERHCKKTGQRRAKAQPFGMVSEVRMGVKLETFVNRSFSLR